MRIKAGRIWLTTWKTCSRISEKNIKLFLVKYLPFFDNCACSASALARKTFALLLSLFCTASPLSRVISVTSPKCPTSRSKIGLSLLSSTVENEKSRARYPVQEERLTGHGDAPNDVH